MEERTPPRNSIINYNKAPDTRMRRTGGTLQLEIVSPIRVGTLCLYEVT